MKVAPKCRLISFKVYNLWAFYSPLNTGCRFSKKAF
jgi:hypothetical protein